MDRPEMRPDNFVPELLGGNAQIPILPPEGKQEFQQAYDQSHQDVDQGLPHHAVNQGFIGVFVDKGNIVRDQDNLGDNQSADAGIDEAGEDDVILFQYKSFGEGDHIERHEEKNRRG